MRRASQNNEELESVETPDGVEDGEAAVGESGELPEEEFDGFDGTWDFEWVAMVDTIMEEVPWTWIAVIVFACAMAYSYHKNRAPKE